MTIVTNVTMVIYGYYCHVCKRSQKLILEGALVIKCIKEKKKSDMEWYFEN